MDAKIIALFCLCDDRLKAMQYHDDRQCQRHEAAIMTTAFTAALCFRGNDESARSSNNTALSRTWSVRVA